MTISLFWCFAVLILWVLKSCGILGGAGIRSLAEPRIPNFGKSFKRPKKTHIYLTNKINNDKLLKSNYGRYKFVFIYLI